MSRAEYLRPSSAGTWVVCSGNIDMRAMFPAAPDESDNEVTEDGTACHWLASEIWDKRFHPEGSLAPNGRVLTEEMFDAVDVYHDVLRSWSPAVAVCEQYIPIPRILDGFGGTPDAWSYDPDKRRLYIADLKYGFRFVEVWENWQLICYVCGLIDLLNLDDQITTVEFTIVQPRSFHRDGPVRKWCVRASDLRPLINILGNAAAAATRYVPNSGCRDCPGRHVCVALQNSAMQAIETAYSGEPYELPPQALSLEMRLINDAIKKLEARKSGLDTQAEALLRDGGMIPGWVLAPSFARETWTDGGAQIMALASLMGVNVSKPAKPVTPNQARKLMPANLVAIYAHKPSTGVRLTKQDPYEAKKVFQNDPR